MKEQFVTIEIAKKLRELGFNEECFTYWEDKYTGIEGIPLWQQVIDWLNFEKELFIRLDKRFNSYNYQVLKYNESKNKNEVVIDEYLSDLKYNEAREQSILKALELIK